MATKKFMELKKMIEVLEVLDEKLNDMETNIKCTYEVISEEVTNEQRKSWQTGELLWEDEEHTIPSYKVNREWGYVERTDKLSEEEEAKLKAIADVRKTLLKLI